MRLTDLDPRWFAEAGRKGQGMTFLCPHCQTCRLAVTFANPADAGEPHPIHKYDVLAASLEQNHSEAERRDIVPPGFLWERKGDDFGMLTIEPSVDASRSGHWHGYIRNGEIQ